VKSSSSRVEDSFQKYDYGNDKNLLNLSSRRITNNIAAFSGRSWSRYGLNLLDDALIVILSLKLAQGRVAARQRCEMLLGGKRSASFRYNLGSGSL
jgi:hypothetical protein